MTINFKPAEKAVIDMLEPTLPIFKSNGMSAEDVRKMYATQLSAVEKSAKCRIDIVDVDGVFRIETVDIGSDFVRTRPTKTALNLRAKKQNVPIVVTVAQPDKDLLLSNKQIAAGLFELAEYVSAMPLEISEVKKTDWPAELGGYPQGVVGNDDDEDEDEELGDGLVTSSTSTLSEENSQDLDPVSDDMPGQTLTNDMPGQTLTNEIPGESFPSESPSEDDGNSLDLMQSNP
jgi:hypothetical protein